MTQLYKGINYYNHSITLFIAVTMVVVRQRIIECKSSTVQIQKKMLQADDEMNSTIESVLKSELMC
jgi:TctA family transporter